jgi:hypothetical protein
MKNDNKDNLNECFWMVVMSGVIFIMLIQITNIA